MMIRFDPQSFQGESWPAGNESLGLPPEPAITPKEESTSFNTGPKEEPLKLDAEQLKQQAIQKRDEMTQAVKSRASSYFDQQKSYFADVINDLTSVTRHCGDEIRQHNHPQLGQLTDALADRMEDVSQSLRNRNMDYFVSQAQTFAKERPALVLGGALALGFLAVRFLKSSGKAQRMIDQTAQQFKGQSSSQESSINQGLHTEAPANAGTQYTI